jgi:6-phosphogluconolactonase
MITTNGFENRFKQMKQILITTDLYNTAAEKFVEIADVAIAERGQFIVALAGGSTPKELYKLLATKKLAWRNVVFFFGDERNVPTDSDESNFKTANETLFKPLNINPQNIYRWQTELIEPAEIAADYADKVTRFAARFDLILLGTGTDGHTASLFPHTTALGETAKSAVENWVEKLNAWRFTLTFKTINHARNIIFLVKGEDKAEILREILEGEFRPAELHSQHIKTESGMLLWLLDKNAVKLLNQDGN